MSSSAALNCTPSQQRRPLDGSTTENGESPGIVFDLSHDLNSDSDQQPAAQQQHQESPSYSHIAGKTPMTPHKAVRIPSVLSPGSVHTPSKRPGSAISPTSNHSRHHHQSATTIQQATRQWEEIVSAHTNSQLYHQQNNIGGGDGHVVVDGQATPRSSSHNSSFSFDMEVVGFGDVDAVGGGAFGTAAHNGHHSNGQPVAASLWNWSGGGVEQQQRHRHNRFLSHSDDGYHGDGGDVSTSDRTLDLENDAADLSTPRNNSNDDAEHLGYAPQRDLVDVDALVALDSPEIDEKYFDNANNSNLPTSGLQNSSARRRVIMGGDQQHQGGGLGGSTSTILSPTSRSYTSSASPTPLPPSSSSAFMNGRRIPPSAVGATPTNTETPSSTRCVSPVATDGGSVPAERSCGVSPLTTTATSQQQQQGKSTSGFQLSVSATPFPGGASSGSLSSAQPATTKALPTVVAAANSGSGRRLPVVVPGSRQPLYRRPLEGTECPSSADSITYQCQNYTVTGPMASSPNAAYHSVVLELKARRRVRCRIAVTMVDRILTQLRRNMKPGEATKAGPNELIGTYLIFQPDQSSVEAHVDAGLCVGVFTSKSRNLIPVRSVGFTDCATILRVASGEDCETINSELPSIEEKAMQCCQELVEAHYLPMVCVDAECAFDKKLIRIFYTTGQPFGALHVSHVQIRLGEQLGMRVSFQCIKPDELDTPASAPYPFGDATTPNRCVVDCVTGLSIESKNSASGVSTASTQGVTPNRLARRLRYFTDVLCSPSYSARSASQHPSPTVSVPSSANHHVDPLNDWQVVSQTSSPSLARSTSPPVVTSVPVTSTIPKDQSNNSWQVSSLTGVPKPSTPQFSAPASMNTSPLVDQSSHYYAQTQPVKWGKKRPSTLAAAAAPFKSSSPPTVASTTPQGITGSKVGGGMVPTSKGGVPLTFPRTPAFETGQGLACQTNTGPLRQISSNNTNLPANSITTTQASTVTKKESTCDNSRRRVVAAVTKISASESIAAATTPSVVASVAPSSAFFNGRRIVLKNQPILSMTSTTKTV